MRTRVNGYAKYNIAIAMQGYRPRQRNTVRSWLFYGHYAYDIAYIIRNPPVLAGCVAVLQCGQVSDRGHDKPDSPPRCLTSRPVPDALIRPASGKRTMAEVIAKAENRPYYLIVQDWLAANIARGTLPDGARLTVSGVAQRLSLSRSPVVRAMDNLVTMAVLSPQGRAGYRVGSSHAGTAAHRAQVVNLFSLPLSLPDTDDLLNAPAEWERVLAELSKAVESCIPFGIYQISESALCEHFAVSRTVTREVLARLDEQHAVRRLLEPAALQLATPRIAKAVLAAMVQRLDAAADLGPTIPPAVMEALEVDLHDTCLAGQPNRRISEAIGQVQGARAVNRLFATHVVQHDESDLLAEHDLVLGHVRLGDATGAAAALRYHLDVDHDRTRDRLKVLSVFADPAVSPYLVRMF